MRTLRLKLGRFSYRKNSLYDKINIEDFAKEMIDMGKELKPLLPGQVFGRLTIIGKDEITSAERKRVFYFCQCSCGSPIKSIWKASLVDKKKPTQSCGCIVKEKAGYIPDRSEALKRLLYEKARDRHLKQLGDVEETFISFESFSKKCDEPCYYCGMLNSSYKKDRKSSFVWLFRGDSG